MAIDPQQTERYFALRTVLLYLSWYYPGSFNQEWIKKAVEQDVDSSLNAGKFVRANPRPENLAQLYDPIRTVVLEKLKTTPVEWPEHMRAVRDLAFDQSPETLPFFLSTWGVQRANGLSEEKLNKLTNDIGGFWYVLRADTHAPYSETISELERTKSLAGADDEPKLRLNCGLLTISPLEHSQIGLPSFRLESARSAGLKYRVNGAVYPHNEEIIFQGTTTPPQGERLCHIHWLQNDPDRDNNCRPGLVLAPNREAASIATMALFVRVPLLPEEQNYKDEKSLTCAQTHTHFFDVMKERARENIALDSLSGLIGRGVVSIDYIDQLISIYKDKTTYYIS